MTCYFYIEYYDGRMAYETGLAEKTARRKYKQFASSDDQQNAKAWGWGTEYEPPRITQKLIQKKVDNQTKTCYN